VFNIEKGQMPPEQAREKGKAIKWPWKDMEVGDLVRIDDKSIMQKAQVYCHAYGRPIGYKFKTQTIDGVLHVWRIA